jgi:hypothetical protein
LIDFSLEIVLHYIPLIMTMLIPNLINALGIGIEIIGIISAIRAYPELEAWREDEWKANVDYSMLLQQAYDRRKVGFIRAARIVLIGISLQLLASLNVISSFLF